MIGFSTIKPVFSQLLSNGLVNKIYYDVTIHEDKAGDRYPVYKDGREQIYVGVDDTQIMCCYLRQISDMTIIRTEFVGSDEKMIVAKVPYRLVFFNDNEKRNFDSITANIMQLMFFKDVSFVRMITDAKTILVQESHVEGFSFDGLTFYTAVDFNATVYFNVNKCAIELICGRLPNPLQLCDVPAIHALLTESGEPILT